MRQLLAVAPRCRNELSASLVWKHAKIVNIHDISMDPGAPIVDVFIDGCFIQGAKIDSGSSVNLMSAETMEEIGLTTMTTTSIILRMVDQSRVKILGIVRRVPTLIGGISFKISYIIFKVSDSLSPYSILLGRPWLWKSKAVDDWNTGTITIGKGSKKIVLPMYLVQYHEETQEEDSDITFEASYDFDIEPSYYVGKSLLIIKPLGMGEYFTNFENNDSDDAILAWKNSPVNVIEAEIESEPEPPHQIDSEELMENLSHSYLPDYKISKSKCIDMNLGTKQEPKSIRVFKGMEKLEYEQWLQFFVAHKDVFAWTYKDLRGISPNVCEHRIILEPNTKPVRQRQYRMNPKYSLYVKEEIDKLLECEFIYLVPYSEWVFSIVVALRRMKNFKFVKIYVNLIVLPKKIIFLYLLLMPS